MLPLGCNISFMLLIDQEHFCWIQAVLHADTNTPSMAFNLGSSPRLGAVQGQEGEEEKQRLLPALPKITYSFVLCFASGF